MPPPDPAPEDPGHWFEAIADALGPDYLRYSFTYGTAQEVDFLIDALGLEPGMRLLDVGCGPGRHAHEFARRGMVVHGIDISQTFVDLAAAAAVANTSFVRADARTLGYAGEFDAVYSLCQGAFGLLARPDGRPAPPVEPDAAALAAMASAVVPGGAVAVSAFSAYFQVRFLEDHDDFDADWGVNHEVAQLVGKEPHDMWTTCFTPRELRLLAAAVGLDVEAVWSVTPGRYARNVPNLDTPEYLLVARRGGVPPG